MNRITAHIEKIARHLDERLKSGVITQAKIEENRKLLDMKMDEFCVFQNIKSAASLDGTLTVEEAQTIYQLLGSTPETFNKQPLAIKLALTKVFEELLGRKIKK